MQKKLALVEERQKLTLRVEALEKKALKHESVIENLQQALQDSRQSEKDLVLARDGLAARLEEMEAESHEIFKVNFLILFWTPLEKCEHVVTTWVDVAVILPRLSVGNTSMLALVQTLFQPDISRCRRQKLEHFY